MKTSPVLVFGAAALVASLVGVIQGCSSATQTLDGQGGTGSVATGMGGTGTTPAPSGSSGSGAAPVGGAITCDGANPSPICEGLNQDMNCNTTNASTGAACTQDCAVECGFDGIGLKICNCEAGVYESCPCTRPAAYQGALTADFCETPDGTGMTGVLDDQPCTEEWSQCIGRDPVSGTPRGCACMRNASTSALQWYCGSTNNWFALVQEGQELNACETVPPADTCAGVNTDASCNSTDARTGSACTKDCQVTCGFNRMGLKYCTCLNGAYSQCPCPKPADYLGAPTAPPCATPDGQTTALDDTPCTTEWEQCIGSDPVTGNTPRGCACLKDPVSGAMSWVCGSTNRWFAPE